MMAEQSTNEFFSRSNYLIYDIYLDQAKNLKVMWPMAVSVEELTQAREMVYRILDELRVDAYIFEVEPHNENWEIIVECAIGEGWSRIRLSAPRKTLLTGNADTKVTRSLYETWRIALAACKCKEKSGES